MASALLAVVQGGTVEAVEEGVLDARFAGGPKASRDPGRISVSYRFAWRSGRLRHANLSAAGCRPDGYRSSLDGPDAYPATREWARRVGRLQPLRGPAGQLAPRCVTELGSSSGRAIKRPSETRSPLLATRERGSHRCEPRPASAASPGWV
jgi:hypothetical protein